jgi:hypothetical protein
MLCIQRWQVVKPPRPRAGINELGMPLAVVSSKFLEANNAVVKLIFQRELHHAEILY